MVVAHFFDSPTSLSRSARMVRRTSSVSSSRFLKWIWLAYLLRFRLELRAVHGGEQAANILTSLKCFGIFVCLSFPCKSLILLLVVHRLLHARQECRHVDAIAEKFLLCFLRRLIVIGDVLQQSKDVLTVLLVSLSH